MTKVINLKSLAKEPAVIIEDEDGERHEMVPTTVEGFIENIQLVENLGTDASAVNEVNAMVKIICRSFPTLTEEKVRKWPIEYLQAISDLARGQNGELVTTDEDKAEEAETSGND